MMGVLTSTNIKTSIYGQRMFQANTCFALDKVLFVNNADCSHYTCEIIFIEEKMIQYYNSMGGDGHAYKNGLMRYIKDEWSVKNGGELPDTNKLKIAGAVDVVP